MHSSLLESFMSVRYRPFSVYKNRRFPKFIKKSNRKEMNRNWSNQNANPALKTKTGNE